MCYKKRNVLYCVLLNYMQSFIQNHWGKGSFSMQELGLFFQSLYLLTLLAAEDIAMK